MEPSLRLAAASIIKRHKAERVDNWRRSGSPEGFCQCFGFVRGNKNTNEQLSLQQVLKLLWVHWQIRSTWLCISIQFESTEFPWQRLTASWQRESPPNGAWNTPTSCLASRSGLPFRRYNSPFHQLLSPPHPRCRVAPPIPHMSGWCWGSPGGVIMRENMSTLSHTARRDTGGHKISTNKKKPVSIFPARWQLWRCRCLWSGDLPVMCASNWGLVR